MKWTENMVAELGTMTDGEFSKKHGLNEKAVAQRRHRAGISAKNKRRKQVVFTKEIIDHIGLMPDKEVSEKFGLSFWQVFEYRRVNNIESFKKYCARLNTCPDAPSNVEVSGCPLTGLTKER
jgi:hypothetical protein